MKKMLMICTIATLLLGLQSCNLYFKDKDEPSITVDFNGNSDSTVMEIDTTLQSNTIVTDSITTK